jgi:hypothetical protein
LRWTAKSTYNLADELVRLGYKVSADTIGRLLKRLGYSLQAPSKQIKVPATPTRTPSSPIWTRPQTRTDHMNQVTEYWGFRSGDLDEVREWLAIEAPVHDRPIVLLHMPCEGSTSSARSAPG